MVERAGMGSDRQSTKMNAADALLRAARSMADPISGDLESLDTLEVLVSLTETQQALDEIYAALAAWHGRAAGRRPPLSAFQTHGEYAAWTHAELALREAVQYGASVAAALVRARHASDEAQAIRNEIENDDNMS